MKGDSRSPTDLLLEISSHNFTHKPSPSLHMLKCVQDWQNAPPLVLMWEVITSRLTLNLTANAQTIPFGYLVTELGCFVVRRSTPKVKVVEEISEPSDPRREMGDIAYLLPNLRHAVLRRLNILKRIFSNERFGL